ncbi:hypothetical protein BLOT_002207 [Blomia tropicalis]|nr:hypothetical protein BLOT_002207 [Blomia tropicalis]
MEADRHVVLLTEGKVIPTTGEKRGFWYKYVTIGCSQHGSNRIRESGRYGADKSCHSYFDQSSEDERERPKINLSLYQN